MHSDLGEQLGISGALAGLPNLFPSHRAAVYYFGHGSSLDDLLESITADEARKQRIIDLYGRSFEEGFQEGKAQARQDIEAASKPETPNTSKPVTRQKKARPRPGS
jgi:hypothetical protein